MKIVNCTLEDICVKNEKAIISGPFGSNIGKRFFVSDGVPVIRGNNLSLSFDKFYDYGFVFVTEEKANELNCYAKKRDLVFTAAGTIGQVGVIPDDAKYQKYVISNKQLRARIDENVVDILYAYYWFSSPWIQKTLLNNNKGSTVPLISLNEMRGLPISFPTSLDDQRNLISIIDSTSRKIQINDQVIAELESMAKTIYDYWFVQFDFPNAEGTPYRSSGGEMVWNEQLKRKIPKGWEVASLDCFGNFKNGINYDKDVVGDKNYKIVNVRNISSGSLFIQSSELDSICLNSKSADSYLVSENSILVARSGIPGATRIIAGNLDNTIYCGFIICFFVNDILSKYYLTYQLKSFESLSANASAGTILKNINQDTLKMFPVATPNKSVLIAFNNCISPLLQKIAKCQSENLELAKLRDWLLPMLMNGQVTME